MMPAHAVTHWLSHLIQITRPSRLSREMIETHEATTQPSVRKNIVGAALGNVVQWYDYAVYAYMAPVIGRLFFPSDDPFESMISTFGAFAAGYISGPIGALLFGHIGDKIGRKAMLMLSILLMGTATTLVGVMPIHDSIGWLAGVGIVALRLLQGFASSGEYTGSLAFICEHSPAKYRGFNSSFILIGSNVGFLLGAGVAALNSMLFSDAIIDQWAWRQPFVIGGVIALAGVLLRSQLSEPPAPSHKDEKLDGLPLIVAFRDYWREMLQIAGLCLTVNAGYYLIFVYVLTYLTTVLSMDNSTATDINMFCVVLMCILPMGFALLGDRYGRKRVLIIGNLAVLVFSYPLFAWIVSGDYWPVLLGQVGFAVIFSCIYGANPAVQVEAAPHRVRATVMTIPANIVAATLTGTMPMVAAFLVQRTHDDMSPAIYLMVFAVLTLIAAAKVREMAGKPLD